MNESKTFTDLEFHWSKESQIVDEQWELKMNSQNRIPRLEDYMDFLENIQPANQIDDSKQQCRVQFTL